MGAAAIAPRADCDSIDAQGQRNVCIGGRTLDARLIADEIVRGSQRSQQRRIRLQFPAGATPEELHLPLQLAFRTVACGFHFVANTRGHAFAQRGFQAREFVFALRANVHLEARFVGNGIHGGATFDLTDVKRCARSGRDFRINEAHRTTDDRVDRIGHTEIRPTVAAGAGNERFEPPRSQRFRGDVVRAGTVENHDCLEFGAIGFDQGAHPAEIAFALFAHVGNKKNRALRF